MQIIHDSVTLREALDKHKRIAFVPTMGNLHEGHLNLVNLAKQHANCVVVSIFVNPLQFGPNEDLDRYPRTLDADCDKLEKLGVSIVYAPSVTDMYPGFDGKSLNQTITVTPPPIASELCGASRPGHFAGVTTVVTKLFNIVQPNVAVFGKKDFQQLYIIRKLVNQLNFPIDIIAGETVRETGGLAMSSRNSNFNDAEKKQAVQLYLALRQMIETIKLNQLDYTIIEKNAKKQLEKQGWVVDYMSIRSSATLRTASNKDIGNLIVLGAASLNGTRLIDNIEFLR
jgi:pantoate--beta-alanine ligase